MSSVKKPRPVTRKRGRDEPAAVETSETAPPTRRSKLGGSQATRSKDQSTTSAARKPGTKKSTTALPKAAPASKPTRATRGQVKAVPSNGEVAKQVKAKKQATAPQKPRRQPKAAQNESQVESQAEKPNPRKRKRQEPAAQSDQAETAEEDPPNDGEAQVTNQVEKRKRGRQRATTPPEAEKAEIDPVSFTMGALVKRDRLGRKSRLETALQEIDWRDVKRRRKEEKTNALMLHNEGGGAGRENRDSEAAVNSRLDHAAKEGPSSQRGPQLKLVDGVMVIDSSTLVTQAQDPTANTGHDGGPLEEVEENDLTARVNTRSWLQNNARDPTEALATMAGTGQWDMEATNLFYDGLRMFGTDFTMISKMFPGRTRRNVKNKFTREERELPDRINAALIGEHVPMDLEKYAQMTGKGQDYYRDPEELRLELKEAEEEQRQEIEKEQAEQREAQQKKHEAEKAKIEAKNKRKEARANKAKDWQRKELDIANGDREESTRAGSQVQRGIEEEEVEGPADEHGYDDD
ncbi:MAG: Transcription factor TFIIIB component B [Chrysothrix sp. TS-e1954]|nr:MAG: Transcription factor TFIIIB component B [Chrysothrix sp. TS-e1954]